MLKELPETVVETANVKALPGKSLKPDLQMRSVRLNIDFCGGLVLPSLHDYLSARFSPRLDQLRNFLFLVLVFCKLDPRR